MIPNRRIVSAARLVVALLASLLPSTVLSAAPALPGTVETKIASSASARRSTRVPQTVKRNAQVATPFERFLAPRIDAFRKAQPAGVRSKAFTPAHANYSGTGG